MYSNCCRNRQTPGQKIFPYESLLTQLCDLGPRCSTDFDAIKTSRLTVWMYNDFLNISHKNDISVQAHDKNSNRCWSLPSLSPSPSLSLSLSLALSISLTLTLSLSLSLSRSLYLSHSLLLFLSLSLSLSLALSLSLTHSFSFVFYHKTFGVSVSFTLFFLVKTLNLKWFIQGEYHVTYYW
jgi:hypothetical protein